MSNNFVREPLEEDCYEITIQKVCTVQKLRLNNYYLKITARDENLYLNYCSRGVDCQEITVGSKRITVGYHTIRKLPMKL
jgi:hypothetical protein